MKILVVDRPEEINGVREMLEAAPGNEVRTATSGQEALDMVQGDKVDLLITEVFLEPMNGFTLRNKMENRHAGVRTIFLTSYDMTPYAEHIAGHEVVPKPATPQKLFPAISRALGSGVAPQPPPAPEAAPVPEAQPQPEPAPQATAMFAPPPTGSVPFAVPKAVPKAVPNAVPRATPAAAAQPVAAPRATPAAGPRSTAVPRAMPAQPARPVAVPRATPGPVAGPVAVPRAAVPVGVPRAAPVAVPAASQPADAAAADPFKGRTLGSYRIERRLGAGKWGPVYMAIQTSMNRPVAMELLAPESAGDEAARQNFVATARAKAAVQHPHILSVYEADQAEGHYFYTHEYVDGSTLAQMLARGEALSEPVALRTIKFVSQGLAHLHQQRIGHSVPDATDIYIGSDGLTYLSNVALPVEELPPAQEEIRALGALVRSMLPGGQAQDRGLQAMLLRMAVTTQAGFQSWPALFQAIQAIEPKVVPVDAFKLSAQDEAAIRAVEDARKRQKMQVILSIAGAFLALCAVAFLVWFQFLRQAGHDYSDEMVHIPAGPFIYGPDRQTKTLPGFYIDKYEVTMAEYAKFLAYLAAHGDPTTFDSPLQPKELQHIPNNWDIYWGRASSSFPQYRTVRGVPISVDCPVFYVNYFDAYAYAKWKGRRLPTEEEWERAARGTAGNLYPWGNDWDPKKLNAGGDYQPDPPPGYTPAVDGFTWWAPVAAFPDDRSPDGVIGMAGNVSEWTDSWDATKSFPVIRGGNFKASTPEKSLVTFAIRNAGPETMGETLGFRTASDTPPAK